SSYRTLHPGQAFDLSDRGTSSDAGSGYAIVWIEHHASSGTYGTTSEGGESYDNGFGCIPKETTFRPRRVTPKPTINGPQTAIVVGPNGEEVFTDEFGRIKVQFHWDRQGAKDEKSSCWIRVGQVLAGKNWGGVFIPRVGQEVIVEFLEGDPDRPLVTGAVYNANNMPPWELPGEKAKSGFESRSHKNGSKENASLLTFDDTNGEEMVTLHAEKDALHEVENDDQVIVGNDRTIEVKGNRTTQIEEGDDSLTVDQGSRTTQIKAGDDSLTISKGNRTTSIGAGSDTLEAAQAIEMKVGQSSLTLTPDAIEIKIGSSSIKLSPTNLDLASTFTAVTGELTTDLKGLVATVEADTALTLQGTIVNIN
ncbi:MAG: type VI secretion system Vgr family protein, partial [Geminicoccaceae bacterium]